MPGSRLTQPPDESPTQRLEIRILALDRPGYGLSAYQPGRQLSAWPVDVAAFADALGLDRFAVAGVSNGGPYALVCAALLPQRVTTCGVISGRGPVDVAAARVGLSPANRDAIRVGQSVFWQFSRLGIWLRFCARQTSADRFWAQQAARAVPADRAILADAAIRAALITATREAFRPGTLGYAWDAALLSRPWGFALPAIRVPVYLWQGIQDPTVPVATGRYLASCLPTCQATFYPDEGHLLMYAHWAEMLACLSRR